MRIPALFAVIFAAAAAPVPAIRLVPVEGGGFAIERDVGVEPPGIASMKELAPLLTAETVKGEQVDYSSGKKLDGAFTIMVGRDDGTLAKFEGATDVIAFAAPETMTTVKGVTTLTGGVVFALKIDNARIVQRFERGVITLMQTKKNP